jgi:flagellar export protein FliJ
MPDPRQLGFLENLAAERSEALAVQLAKARQALGAAEQQLAMLEQYAGGYRTQLGAKLEATLGIEALRGHQRFAHNIQQAIRQQELEVARRRVQADAAERAWQDSERRRQGFRVMGTQLATRTRRAADRVAQKQSDEFSTRGATRTTIDH